MSLAEGEAFPPSRASRYAATTFIVKRWMCSREVEESLQSVQGDTARERKRASLGKP
jgi:ABC-type long-subunit fatty acid transport system fused permease/ATPase subunit